MKALKHISSIVVLLMFLACGSEQEQHTNEDVSHEATDEVTLTREQLNTAGIQTGKVITRVMGNVITANGKLDVPPQQMVSVSVPIAGFVKKTSLLEGVYVRSGQSIAVLENLDYIQIQQDYLDIKSKYEYATKEYERQQQLADEKVNAEKTLQDAKAKFQSLQAQYKGLESKLRLININPSAIVEGNISSTINVYASINGYISDVNINVGQYVSPNDVLFRIVNTEHLHVELTVFEKDVSRIKEGQQVRFTLANETKERYATVHLIGKKISNDRTILVHCHLATEDTRLLPGMFLKAYIETDKTEVYALPESAIIRFEGNDYVFIQNEAQDSMYHYKMIKAETGSSDQGYTQVSLTGALGRESNIVLNGGYALLATLKNGDEVGGHAH